MVAPIYNSENEDHLLNNALINVRTYATNMKNCFERLKLMDGLKFCSTMLNELRTSDLSPKAYYALYMTVVDELHFLEDFLSEEVKRNVKITDVYELVQYAGNIVPRLYLLITVGIVYIKSLDPTSNVGLQRRSEVIRDLVEMCRGVQHPLRGLFLRYYLLQSLRNILPDVKGAVSLSPSPDSTFAAADKNDKGDHILNDSQTKNGNLSTVTEMQTIRDEDDFDDDNHMKSFVKVPDPNTITNGVSNDAHNPALNGNHSHTESLGNANLNFTDPRIMNNGSVLDSIDFLLANFAEMNKLWVRMQHLGHSKERERREAERRDLRLLVGTNLVRISELDSIGIEEYRRKILPGILEQIVSCRDVIAQEYIMECIIQVFPDEFHLATLTSFLKACSQLQPEVKVKNIMISLINRLTSYAHNEGPEALVVGKDTKLFDVFAEQIFNILQSKNITITPEDTVSLQNCLINLALTCYPDQLEYMDRCLNTISTMFDKLHISKIHNASPLCRELTKTVKCIVDAYFQMADLLRLTRLKYMTRILRYFDKPGSLDVCVYIVDKFLELGKSISTIEQVNDVMHLVEPLYRYVPTAVIREEPNTGTPIVNPPFISTNNEESDENDAQIELAKLFKLFHVANMDDNKTQNKSTESFQRAQFNFQIMQKVYSFFENLSASPTLYLKLKYSVPAIIFSVIDIIQDMLRNHFNTDSSTNQSEIPEDDFVTQLTNMTTFMHTAIFALSEKELFEIALKLYLQATQCVDMIIKTAFKRKSIPSSNEDGEKNSEKSFNNLQNIGHYEKFESIAYEYMSQCFSIFEDDISDSKILLTCLNLIIGTFYCLTCFMQENHESLRRQCFSSVSKLLKKPDQARAYCLIVHIYWSTHMLEIEGNSENNNVDKSLKIIRIKDQSKVSACLNKALTITEHCMNMDVKIQLFTEILSHAYLLQQEDREDLFPKSFINETMVKVEKLVQQINEKKDSTTPFNPLVFKQYETVKDMISIYLDKNYDDLVKSFKIINI